jgi:hypothetical protein
MTPSLRRTSSIKKLFAALAFTLCLPFTPASLAQSTPSLPVDNLWGLYTNRVTDGGLQNRFVRGVMINVSWRDIQRWGKKTFKWSDVDRQLVQAKAAGKDVTFILHAGGQNTPDWVKNTPGVQLIDIIDTSNTYHATYCDLISIPVFWDPAFLEMKKNFIEKAGERYGDDPSISGVMVPFANFITSDWNVPHDVDPTGEKCGKTFDQIIDWKKAGYTTEKMLDAGKQTLDAWAAAFPGRAMKLPVHPTHQSLEDGMDGTPPTATKLAQLIIEYGYGAYPDRFIAQVNTLNTETAHPASPKITRANPNSNEYILKILADYPGRIGFQMLAAASNGEEDNCRQNRNQSPCDPYAVFLESVEAGLLYDPLYIEVWHEDAENVELLGIFKDVYREMIQRLDRCGSVISDDHYRSRRERLWVETLCRGGQLRSPFTLK